jgi:hypothetical protein
MVHHGHQLCVDSFIVLKFDRWIQSFLRDGFRLKKKSERQ